MNINELKCEIARKGLTIPRLAALMGISKKRLYSRMKQSSSFTLNEIISIVRILELDAKAIIRIFFATMVS